MIRIPPLLLAEIVDAAERAYPEECCGLLIGRGCADGGTEVTGVAASANVAQGRRRDRFEVDPQVRFDVMRSLEGGPERIVGHYHSHPDHPARPSAHDLEQAWEPEMIWVIVSVSGGRAAAVTAHVLAPDGRRFRRLDLVSAETGQKV